jgi:hypothetical protein
LDSSHLQLIKQEVTSKELAPPKGSSAQSARLKDFQEEMLANEIATEWQDRVQLAGGRK